MPSVEKQPIGYKWRSSRILAIGTACLALFTEALLFGFVVPILPYMLEERLHKDPSETQALTTSILGILGFVSLVSAPILAHFIDKTPGRRLPLLLSLSLALVGTIFVSLTLNYWTLVLGRVFQGVAGAAAWIICMAVFIENSSEKNRGSMLGLNMSIVMTGTVAGPMISGLLLEKAGYWPVCSVPIGFLVFDIFVWLLLIEKPPKSSHNETQHPNTGIAPEHEANQFAEDLNSENSPLLAPIVRTDSKDVEIHQNAERNFYAVMMTDIRVIVSLLNVVTGSLIVSGLNTTLPVHLRAIFEWGPFEVGSMFLILRVPAIVLGPLSGWLRDRIGLRWPTTIAWLLETPLLILMGLPGSGISWLDGDSYGKSTFVFCIAGLGAMFPFVQGTGILNIVFILDELESKQPGIFGPNGAKTRAFAITEISFNLGLLLGPLLAGPMSEHVGFSQMAIVLGVITMMLGISSYIYFPVRESEGRRDSIQMLRYLTANIEPPYYY